MIAAGHLRPGITMPGNLDYFEFKNYFENPAKPCIPLPALIHTVDPSVQAQLKAYLKVEFGRYFDPGMYIQYWLGRRRRARGFGIAP